MEKNGIVQLVPSMVAASCRAELTLQLLGNHPKHITWYLLPASTARGALALILPVCLQLPKMPFAEDWGKLGCFCGASAVLPFSCTCCGRRQQGLGSFTQCCNWNSAAARLCAQLGAMPKWELKVCSGISTPKHINILGAGKGASEWECWAGSSGFWKMCRNRYSGGT